MKWGSVQFYFWALREWTIKKILLLQSPDLSRAYQFWRTFHPASRQPAPLPIQPLTAGHQPIASLVVRAVQGDSPSSVAKTLQSFLKQSSAGWEALILLDGMPDETLQLLLNDPRFTFVNTLDLSRANLFEYASRRTTGTYVAWVPPGATLCAEAISMLAQQSGEVPKFDLVYYDDDVEDRRDPIFKPGWSPELLLSLNYIRGAFYKKSMLLDGLNDRSILPPSSEWDLALQCIPRIQNVLRIPHVLLHRPLQNSDGQLEKGQDVEAAVRYLARLGADQPQALVHSGMPRFTWQPGRHKVSVIIPTRDNLTLLQKCIDSVLAEQKLIDLDIILMDTGSQDPAVEAYYQKLRADVGVRIYTDKAPFNYSRVNNTGASHAAGDLLLFLNNDVEAQEPGWLGELTRWTEIPGIGVVGARLVYPDQTIQHAGTIVGMEGHCSHVFGFMKGDQPTPYGSVNWYRNYLAVTGACMMVKRDLFETVGRFDENYELVFSDIELCLRIHQSGYRILGTPFCRLIHHEGKSRGRTIPPQDILLGYQHFINQVRQGDPYYHPRLSYSVRRPVFGWGFEERPVKRLEIIRSHASDKL